MHFGSPSRSYIEPYGTNRLDLTRIDHGSGKTDQISSEKQLSASLHHPPPLVPQRPERLEMIQSETVSAEGGSGVERHLRQKRIITHLLMEADN